MNGRPTYDARALQRISELGEKTIIAFFKDVSPSLRRAVASDLPAISGFRPGTTPSIDRQIQALAHRLAMSSLSKSFAKSTEEVALYGLWCGWAEGHLGDPAAVRPLLDAFDRANGGEPSSDALQEPMRHTVQTLVAAGATSREALDHFIAFSPFASIEEFTALIQQAPTAAQIEHESAIRALPDRLHKDEELLEAVQARLDGFDRDFRKVRSELESVARTLAEARNAGEQDRAAFAALAKKVELVLEGLSQDNILAGLVKRVEHSERRHDAADEARMAADRDSAALIAAIGESREALAALRRRDDTQTSTRHLEEGVARLDTQMKEIEAQLAPIAALTQRLEQVETMLLEIADRPVTVADPGRVTESIHRLALDPGLSVKPLANVREMLASLDAALADSGLKKTAAATFSEEILAALATEQVVFLRGSYAVDVGRKCALSLCGSAVYRFAIPMGLTDPAAIRQDLSRHIAKSRGATAAVVIEGINNAPLDVMRDVLLDQASQRVGNTGPSLVFAGLVEGDGAFPLDPTYLELGPIFDLEHMDWRRIKREKLPILGTAPKDIWQTIASDWESKTVDYEEPLRGARRLARRANARVESNVVRAYAALRALRRAKDGPTVLQSLTFGWLSPYWSALGAKRDAIDAEIDGGKCDGTAIDERLKAFLTGYAALQEGGAP